MNKNYALKLTIVSLFIGVAIFVITGCSNHKLASCEAEQDSCIVEHNNIGPNPNEVVQNWRKK
ncbi:hypothetical protein [Clostridium beijerinckii]|uniref:hypothetical protein n=1 Tax=Clostridium beijerinckii TaxID=1520 RepID=UPI0003D2E74B|nr:hypothetical protein [Clostridium beijerinckii]ALB44981.1 hypothetical protein X276_06695 [Clostridium beijerinckii NRRL B-598]